MSQWGDSVADLERRVAASRPSSRARWERPLLNVSHNAPASKKATKSADRRMSGSHRNRRHSDHTILPRCLAGRALRVLTLRALPTALLRHRACDVNRSRPPPLDTTDLLIEGPA